jgi:hypothetical protein
MGWEVVSVFKDEGRSGYSGEFRPGFEDMLTFLSRGDVQVLIARHHDRLTRNAEDFDRLMKICGNPRSRSALIPAVSWICRQRAAGSTVSWRLVDLGTNRRSGASE